MATTSGYMQNTYTVQRKWRTVDIYGKPSGPWRYHDLFATENRDHAFDYLEDRPDDQPWELTILVISR